MAVDAGHVVMMETMEYGERRERVLLRPWLENLINCGVIPGLEWIDEARTMFKVPWKHRSKKNWSLRHSSVFLEWAKNTGRWKEGDPEPNYAQLKTRLRCAFNKAPDIEEMKELHCTKSEEPYKVYRFTERRDGKARPLVRMFVTKTSSGPHVIRRRRRPPKLIPSRPMMKVMTSDVGRDMPAPPTSVTGLKIEPSNEMVSCYRPMECMWKTEMPTSSEYMRSRDITSYSADSMAIRRSSIPLPVELEQRCFVDDDFKPVSPTMSCGRILPPPEADYGMPSPPDWTPPFPMISSHLVSSSALVSSVSMAHDSRLLILQAASEVVEANATNHHRQLQHCSGLAGHDRNNGADTESSAISVSPHDSLVIQPQSSNNEQLLMKEPPVMSEASSEQISPSCASLPDLIDDTAPPMVRFKKRYLRSQQIEEKKQQMLASTMVDVPRSFSSVSSGVAKNSLRTISPVSPSELFSDQPDMLKLAPTHDASDHVDMLPHPCRGDRWSSYYETMHQLPEKRNWSRAIDGEVKYGASSCADGLGDVGRRPSVERDSYEMYEPVVKQRHIIHRASLEGVEEYPPYSPKYVSTSRPTASETILYREMVPCRPESPVSAAVNLSYKLEESPYDFEAIDLSKKSPPTSLFESMKQSSVNRSPVVFDSKPVDQWTNAADTLSRQNETMPVHAKELVHAHADIRHKSDLIMSKTAVLFDKERQLRALEKELVAREEALYWQEHQLHKPPADSIGKLSTLSPTAMSDSCARKMVPDHRLMPTQRVLPSHDMNHAMISTSGWPVEKLEEQFARLVQTSQDMMPGQQKVTGLSHDYAGSGAVDDYGILVQKRSSGFASHLIPNPGAYQCQSSPPGLHGMTRKRGRPKGSRNRILMAGTSALHDHLKPNFYVKATMSQDGKQAPQMAQDIPSPPYAFDRLATHLKSEPVEPRCATDMPIRPAVPADNFLRPNAMKIFSGGQLLSVNSNNSRAHRVDGHPMTFQSDVRSRQVGMPLKVRQMLETTAGTTGASILPPLSPTSASNDQRVIDLNSRSRNAVIQNGDEPSCYADHSFKPSQQHSNGHFSSYSNGADYRTTNYEHGYVGDIQPRTTSYNRLASHPPTNVGNQLHEYNRRLSDGDSSGTSIRHLDPVKWHDSNTDRHILPNASSSFDSSVQWDITKRNRVEEWRREVASTCGGSNDDESDGRLVMVLDGD
jgi:hypothetical protein